MHLKSLTLRGFKSFADKTVLKFEPGITVIVGPNGSGKSNLTDASLWVLGEQSPTSLRGASMEDVIFTGSAERLALGVAEVSLCLDNSDGYLPIEFSEVTITRWVSRSGESTYFINNSPCRLLDVQELLSDSGLGREMYSIISQGRLEETLSAKSEERKVLIEEAAGVFKHKKRKERALRKFVSMDYNLTRARDILKEINRQLRPLKNQANLAEAHAKLTEKLKELEVGLATAELKALQSQWDLLGKQEAKLSPRIEDLKKELKKEEDRIETLQYQLEEKGIYAGDLGEQRRRTQSIQERLNTGLLLLEEKGKNLIQRMSELRQVVHQLKNKEKRCSEELDELMEEKGSLDNQLSNLYASLAELRRRSEEAKKKRKEMEERLEKVRTELSIKEDQLREKEQQLDTLKVEIKTAASQIEWLKKEQKKNVSYQAKLKKTLGTLEEKYTQSKAETEEANQKLSSIDNQISKVGQALEQAKEERSDLKDKLTHLQARVKALQDFSEVSDYPKELIQVASPKEKRGVIGILKELVEIPKQHEKAIWAVLGTDLSCLITKSLKDTQDLISLLEEKGKERVSFYSLKGFKKLATKKISSATPAAQVVKCSSQIKPAIEGLLSHIYLVDDFDTAIELACSSKSPQASFVTPEGVVVTSKGKISAGWGGKPVPLANQQELTALESEEKELVNLLRVKTNQVRKAEKKITSLHQEKEKIVSTVTQKQVEVKDLSTRSEHLKVGLADSIAKHKSLVEDVNLLAKKVEENSEAVKSLEKEITLKRKEVSSLRKELPLASQERDGCFGRETKVTSEVIKTQLQINSVSNLQRQNKGREVSLESELENIKEQLKAEGNIIEALESLRLRVQPVHNLYSILLQPADFWAKRLKDLATGEEELSQSLRQSLRQGQTKIKSINENLNELNIKLHDVEMAKGKLEFKVTSVVEKIVKDYDVPLEKALQRELKVPEEECQAQIEKLRKKIAVLGPINPVAVKEYKDLEERRDFFTSQIDDLLKSKRTLNKVIQAIDKKIKDRFLQIFEEVNVHFQSVFSYLFPGGSAQLILTNSDDIETSGVDIVAQPQGKKLTSLSLLSAGERALVVLALLFAICHIRPSPFYILDEVEASLDDINLSRFIELIKKLQENTQFLIVTHQRRTMEIADLLYGVSMQADGVSKLVSQRMAGREVSQARSS